MLNDSMAGRATNKKSTAEVTAIKAMTSQVNWALLGLVIAWQIFNRFYPDLFAAATNLFYVGYPLS